MSRIAVLLGAAIASVATIAVIATSGSAQTAGTTTLHLVDTNQNSIGFFPHHKPKAGDRFGFGNKTSGDDTGFDRGVCTVIDNGRALCTVQVNLSKGILTAQGFVNTRVERAKNAPFVVTGGTGAYDGARGTALVTDVTSKTSKIEVALLP
jgi:hypothetical protein